MSQSESDHFKSKIRTIFWPIKRYELAKFIPMAALMFCVLFNQNILRILKDSILISEISAEITSFAKVYCVTPAATIFVIIYAKLINHLTFEKIFYHLVSFFTGFYVIFAFILYPNIDFFHMNGEKLDYLMSAYPHFKWYIAILGNWGYIIFYTLSELWPNVFYILLFWQLANEITSTKEAKRFYTLFSLFGNSSVIVVGLLMLNLSSEESITRKLFTISDSKILLIQVSTSFVALSAICSCLLVRYITKRVMTNPNLYLRPPEELSKNKMGLIESFKYIARSKYLWLMLICSASFGLSMNLVEAVWKAKIKELYPSVTEFAAFSSIYILWTGVVIMILTVVGTNIMRTRSWFTAAVITPIVILITGSIFFVLVVFDEVIFSFYEGAIITTPLALAVSVGAIQNILSKGSKYSIWDTSREMLYIPLDQELRTQGKAAVDVISPKIGKSASGLVQSVIFTILPTATYNSISSSLMVIFIVVCLLWIYSVRKIYFEYQKIV
jgi:ATP:ADP antiporter, AAA family